MDPEMADRGACPVIRKPLTPVTMVTRDIIITTRRVPRFKADFQDVHVLIKLLFDTLGLPSNATPADIVCKLQMKMAESNPQFKDMESLAKDFGIESVGDLDDSVSIACQLRQKFVAMETECLSTKKNLKKFKSRVKRRDIKIKSLRLKVEEAEKSTSKRKEELLLARDKENTLNSDLERIKVQYSDNSNKFEKQYHQVTKMVDDFKAQLEATQDQNQNYTIRIAELQEEITRTKLEKEQFESQLQVMELKVSQIENDAVEAVKEEMNRSDEIKKEMTSQIEHWSMKSDGMEKLVNQLEKTLSKLEAEKDEYQHQLQISSDNLTETTTSLHDFEKKYFDLEHENAGLRSKLKKLEIDQHLLDNKIKEMKETTEKALKENEKLEIQLDSAQQECLRMEAEINKRNEEMYSLQKHCEDSDRENELLLNELKGFHQMLMAARLSTGLINSVDQKIDIGMIVRSYDNMKERCSKLEQEVKDMKKSKMLSSATYDDASSTPRSSTGLGASKEAGSCSEIEELRFKIKTQDHMITKLRYNISMFQQSVLSDKGSLEASDVSVVDRAIITLIPQEDIPTIQESQLQPWDTIDTKRIGKGTFGEVYLKRLGADAVAVKVQGTNEDKKVNIEDLKKMISLNHSRTMKEVAVLRLLETHPAFPRCYGYTKHASSPGLVVEFLGDIDTGTVHPLSKAIKTKNPALSDQDWLNIVVDITEGVHAMHERDLLHNDIKPNNILLQRDDRWRAYIIDMGNVTTVTMPHKNRNLTDHEVEGYKLGVVYQHLAPEYILDGEYSSIQSDIFSLGRILHYVSRVTHNSDLFNLATSMINNHPHLRPSWKEINRVLKAVKNRRTTN